MRGRRVAVTLAQLSMLVLPACKTRRLVRADRRWRPSPGCGRAPQWPRLLKNGASTGLCSPYGATVDRSDNVHVVDTGDDRMVKSDPSGKELLIFGRKGRGAGRVPSGEVAAISPRDIRCGDLLDPGLCCRREVSKPRGWIGSIPLSSCEARHRS
jgi:hypothetical protein